MSMCYKWSGFLRLLNVGQAKRLLFCEPRKLLDSDSELLIFESFRKFSLQSISVLYKI